MPKDVGHFLVQNRQKLISVHARAEGRKTRCKRKERHAVMLQMPS